jgi:hypothetical protein
MMKAEVGRIVVVVHEPELRVFGPWPLPASAGLVRANCLILSAVEADRNDQKGKIRCPQPTSRRLTCCQEMDGVEVVSVSPLFAEQVPLRMHARR